MGTVSELQVGDGARVRVDVGELRWDVEQPMWVRSNYFWTVFLSHDYDTIYVKFKRVKCIMK